MDPVSCNSVSCDSVSCKVINVWLLGTEHVAPILGKDFDGATPILGENFEDGDFGAGDLL
jgi:hypothetical protein